MSDYEELAEELEGNIKSSGETRKFETGAQRDSNTKVHKGRMDLIPAVAMNRMAEYYLDISPIIDKYDFHSLHYYNMAMDSMYRWLEGERMERDGGNFQVDHLSYALYCVIQMMQIEEDLSIWFPEIHPDYDNYDVPRYDMISPLFLKRVSVHYQLGGINYGDRNWELGMPVMVTWDSATRHLTNWLDKETTEDHLAAVGWNIMCTMHTIEMVNRGLLPENLYDPPMHRNIHIKTPYKNKLENEDSEQENAPEYHTGFCMSTYNPRKCWDCFSKNKCLEMGEKEKGSPIHYDDGWYFWDETGANRVGPFTRYMDVKIALKLYEINLKK